MGTANPMMTQRQGKAQHLNEKALPVSGESRHVQGGLA
jgi:hypothetical protein